MLNKVVQANIPLKEDPAERPLSDFVADIIFQHKADFGDKEEDFVNFAV